MTPEPRKADSVLDHVLVKDLDDLTARIKRGILEFIEAVEGFFANQPE